MKRVSVILILALTLLCMNAIIALAGTTGYSSLGGITNEYMGAYSSDGTNYYAAINYYPSGPILSYGWLGIITNMTTGATNTFATNNSSTWYESSVPIKNGDVVKYSIDNGQLNGESSIVITGSLTAIIPGSLPSAPTGLSSNAIDNTLFTVSWPVQSGALSYNVYKNSVLIGDTTSESYTITGLQPGTQYSITVSAVNNIGVGTQSDPLLVTTLNKVNLPTNQKLQIVLVSTDGTQYYDTTTNSVQQFNLTQIKDQSDMTGPHTSNFVISHE